MVGYPQVSEELLEVVALVDVVVGAEHTQEDALAEAAWADEEEEIVGVLHHGDVSCLVDKIEVVSSELLEVGYAVGKSSDRCHDNAGIGFDLGFDTAKIHNFREKESPWGRNFASLIHSNSLLAVREICAT